MCERRYQGPGLGWFFDQWVYRGGQPEYEHYWEVKRSGNNHKVYLTIRQIQSGSVFTMPIDIRFSLPLGDSTVVVWNNKPVQHYQIIMPENVTAVALDPEEWILKTEGGSRKLSAVPNLNVYPNPFNAEVTITFETNSTGMVEVAIYDVTGARVRVLQKGDLPPAFHQLPWDGRNAAGTPVAKGVYFVRLKAPKVSWVKKAVLVR